MAEALKSMGFDPTAKEAKSIVARYDKDRSGSMELDEWAQLVSEFRRLQDRELADLRRDLSNLAELRSQLELAERAKAFPPDVRGTRLGACNASEPATPRSLQRPACGGGIILPHAACRLQP